MRRQMIGSGVCWLFSLLCGILLAIFVGSVWAWSAAALLLLLPTGSAVWNCLAFRNPEGKILLPSTAQKDTELTGSITVTAQGLPPAGRVYARMETVNELTDEKAVLVLPLRYTDQGWQGDFTLSAAHCGRLRLGVSAVFLTDLFGFIPCRRTAAVQSHCVILPETFAVELNDTVLYSAAEDSDDSREDRRGHDMTVTYQMREYQGGDDLHGIHWKLSSKLDKLIFREPGETVDRSLLLYWDQSAGDAAQLDTLAEAVFSVGQCLSESGCAYTLGWSSEGETQFADVGNQEELLQKLPLLLYRHGAQQPSGGELQRFGRVLYFTADAPIDPVDSFRVFCCGRADDPAADFTPENYREVLQRLDVAYEA